MNIIDENSDCETLDPEIVDRLLQLSSDASRYKAQEDMVVRAMQYVETAQYEYLLLEQELLNGELKNALRDKKTELCRYLQLRIGVISDMMKELKVGNMRFRVATKELQILKRRLKSIDPLSDKDLFIHVMARIEVLKAIKDGLKEGSKRAEAQRMANEIPYFNTKVQAAVSKFSGRRKRIKQFVKA